MALVRTGLVLSPSGGMLGRLRPLFSIGLGARIGNGRQYMPWITLEDEVRAFFAPYEEHAALAGIYALHRRYV